MTGQTETGKNSASAAKTSNTAEVKSFTNGNVYKPEEKPAPRQRHKLIVTIQDSGTVKQMQIVYAGWCIL